MKHSILKWLGLLMVLSMLLTLAPAALASPPYPEGSVTVQPPEDVGVKPGARMPKSIDQPNIKDYLRNRERQRLLEAGLTAEASALGLAGTDRVLVILVEFAGTDTFTWEAGVSTWDPLGRADPNEYTGTVGDCSLIITQTTEFTYAGPLHNEMPRPLSPDDRSGDSIWTEDFTPQWFDDFMFGNGVVFDYTRVDGSTVYEDFTGESVKLYYQDQSGGAYDFTGDVIGWVQVPHSTWYYDADECPGARSGGGSRGAIPGAGTARTLVKDALDAVNAIADTLPGFDWANYDVDGDGIIDRLWIVHAGYGEEDSTVLLNRTDYGESAVWSHSSSVSPAYEVAPGISAGPYIMMPENGGIGVFAHEYGHNLGADDLYAYGLGETSAGFWTLMADDWTGHPIGFEPPATDPWHLDNWGWLNPFVISDMSQSYEITLGQASLFPGGEDVYRGVKIPLPDGVLDLAVPVWQGDYYWWGGKQDLANAMMTTVNPVAIPAAGGTLSFDLVYDIEDEWDFLWIQASADGETWDTLTNENTQCEHDPSWIGGLYGFPEDLCGAGLGGFYGWNANWPDPEVQEFDLSAYAGQSIYLRFWFMTDWGTTYTGAFVDNVMVTANGSTLFEDDAESGDAQWVYQDPWQRSDGTMAFTHNYYLQWRNVGENGGYDSALGDPRWRFGPANSGLLVWYNNNFYTDNEIWSYFLDDPSVGPKGRMLVVDAHPEPYRDPDLLAMGYNNTGANLTSRGQMRDAPFSLWDSVDFWHTDPYQEGAQEHWYEGRPAMSAFHDALGYYPGAEYVNRGPYYPPTQFKWVTKQWDASAVVPATGFYPLKAPGYTANEEFRFNCTPYLSGPYTGALGCYWFGSGVGLGYDGGSGNPSDDGVQYGVNACLLDQAEDGSWGKILFANFKPDGSGFTANPLEVVEGQEVEFVLAPHNLGGNSPVFVFVPWDYQDGQLLMDTLTNGAFPIYGEWGSAQVAALYAEQGVEALQALAVDGGGGDPIAGIGWIGDVPAGTNELFRFKMIPWWGGYPFDLKADFYLCGDRATTLRSDEVKVLLSGGPFEYSLWPMMDTFVSSVRPNASFADRATFNVAQPDAARGLLYFDSSWIPPLAVVDSAKLKLYPLVRTRDRWMHLVAYPMEEWWWESITWNEAPDSGDIPAGSAALDSVNMVVELDVTALVQQWISDPMTNYGLMLKGEEAEAVVYTFMASEHRIGQWPRLEIIVH